MSFERKNLAYIVRPTENKQEELLHILNSVPAAPLSIPATGNVHVKLPNYWSITA